MLVKIIKSRRDIVTICDSELLGKKFEQEQWQLDVKENFFDGAEMDKEETMKIIERMAREDATFNIIGKESIEVALEMGIIEEKSIKKIQDIPFAMVLA